MVTLLFTSIAVIIVFIVAAYLWQRPPQRSRLQQLEGSTSFAPDGKGLFPFDNTTSTNAITVGASLTRESLLARAEAGDNSAALDANKNFDAKIYGEILAALVRQADSDAKLLSVLSYITRTELPVTKDLAEAAVKSWLVTPDRGSTARTLHITALADDARLYQSTAETALKLWRAGSLTDVPAAELRALIDGEYWVLSNKTRNSGSGFVLKHSLSKARRELEAAVRIK